MIRTSAYILEDGIQPITDGEGYKTEGGQGLESFDQEYWELPSREGANDVPL